MPRPKHIVIAAEQDQVIATEQDHVAYRIEDIEVDAMEAQTFTIFHTVALTVSRLYQFPYISQAGVKSLVDDIEASVRTATNNLTIIPPLRPASFVRNFMIYDYVGSTVLSRHCTIPRMYVYTAEAAIGRGVVPLGKLGSWGEILPELTCRYLGLIMDFTLTWKQHIDEVGRKVSTALSSPLNSAWSDDIQGRGRAANNVRLFSVVQCWPRNQRVYQENKATPRKTADPGRKSNERGFQGDVIPTLVAETSDVHRRRRREGPEGISEEVTTRAERSRRQRRNASSVTKNMNKASAALHDYQWQLPLLKAAKNGCRPSPPYAELGKTTQAAIPPILGILDDALIGLNGPSSAVRQLLNKHFGHTFPPLSDASSVLHSVLKSQMSYAVLFTAHQNTYAIHTLSKALIVNVAYAAKILLMHAGAYKYRHSSPTISVRLASSGQAAPGVTNLKTAGGAEGTPSTNILGQRPHT
ncbi:hypothetical protein ACRALDRAFT_206476 [Sodiomyces alcalophilus JCM 7366]|uniref:uncharacterized protein n=1 Tax=Sodiomyces alcalophilus JCM 7366 TaxID=591952 RepID=UPI0039B60F2B